MTAKTEKACTKCGIVKPLADFYAAKRNSDGRKSWCKVCEIEYSRQYQKTPKGKDVKRRYAQEVQGQLEAANPARQSEQIAKSVATEVAKALGPIAEQIGLLTAKMGQQVAPHSQSGQGLQEVYFPQQKSMSIGTPQPVQAEGGHRVSPVLGKPSPLTDIIRKSVGLQS